MKIYPMRYHLSAVFFIASCGPLLAFTAQPPAVAQQPANQTAPAETQRTPSTIMQPALDALQQTIGVLRPDKWKTSDAVRQETSSNIDSIHRDLETTLPLLLAAADGSPESVSRMFPAYRNIEALYDVLLRVAEAGDLTAPRQQNEALERARVALEGGRRAFGDRLNSAALEQDQKVQKLQAALRAVPPAPTAVECPPPPPVKKHKTRKKAVTKPASAAPGPQGTATSSH